MPEPLSPNDPTLTVDQAALAGSAAIPHSLPVVPGYELGELIGRGGMGDVYRARDVEMDREVAVKILQDRYAVGSATAIRFVEEAKITGQMQHPGIPAIHRVSTLADGRPFLAMKLIKGQTLDELLKAKAKINTLAIVESIAQALGYAHAHRVIHRDIKPANVMVGPFGEVQLMDWGLSKVLDATTVSTALLDPDETAAGTVIRSARDSSRTQAGSVMGTPAYMPPE
ncbi:MAG: serine/threonine protein kinase [Gemmataceae bacterium]|nr:serine/threonine protein kinase [Gemmataceae bacterium]